MYTHKDSIVTRSQDAADDLVARAVAFVTAAGGIIHSKEVRTCYAPTGELEVDVVIDYEPSIQ